MDYPARSFDWAQARAFLASAEAGSFSGAARRLGLTQPTLGRQVAALEEALGVVLFERTGRSLYLTEAGADLLPHARAMAEAADRVALAAAGHAHDLSGLVRISASDIYAQVLLPAFCARLRQMAPRLRLDIVARNDLSDLQRREADIAIRHVRPSQPDLIARLVREAHAGFYAAPAYLARKGRPESRAALARHEIIGFGPEEELVRYLKEIGITVVPEQIILTSANGPVAWEYVRQGFGLGLMDHAIAARTPGVERVLDAEVSVGFPVWLTTHREVQSSQRLRVVYDALAEFFAGL